MKDDTTPATKGDIRHLDARMDKMDGDIQTLDTRIDKLDTKVERMGAELRAEMREMGRGLHKAIDEVLTVLVNVDKRLTVSVVDHEKRIKTLETLAGVSA